MEYGLAIDRPRARSGLIPDADSQNDFPATPHAGSDTRQVVLLRKVAHDGFEALGSGALSDEICEETRGRGDGHAFRTALER